MKNTSSLGSDMKRWKCCSKSRMEKYKILICGHFNIIKYKYTHKIVNREIVN